MLPHFMLFMHFTNTCSWCPGEQEDDINVFTLDGECDEVVQNCARDQFLLEALLTALVAPVTAGIVKEHPDNNQGKEVYVCMFVCFIHVQTHDQFQNMDAEVLTMLLV